MKRILAFSMVLAAVAMLATSCNCYRKMAKKADRIEATSSPKLLTLKGNQVPVEITVTFPPRYFDAQAVLRITPVLVFDGGEIAGTPKFVQGERVKDNFTVISSQNGGSYTQSVVFPWDERASVSTLVLRVEAKCNAACAERFNDYLPLAGGDIAIARGVSLLQNSVRGIDMAIMPDNFKRVTTLTQDAELLYQISQSNVRRTELTKEQVKLFEAFVKENQNKERTELTTIYSKGYASPDGPVDLNDRLSRQRGDAGKAAISKQLKNVNVPYDVAAYGEDWDGFKKLVEASDIKDKALILQVLQMYDNPVRRDQEIHNLSSVFNVLAKEVLPKLRRTVLTANADVTGKSDAEIKAADMSALNLEELLYSATLQSANDAKAKIYSYAADKFNDVRAYNNLGVVLTNSGKLAEAAQAFAKAASLASAPEISNNLGALALAEGKTADAKRYLSSLSLPQSKTNLGLLALQEGDYAAAERNLKGYDLALAEVLSGDLNGAKAAISADQSAAADYLRGVIAARQGDSRGAIANLKAAIAKDSSYRAKVKKDIEFVALFADAEFQAL